MTFGSDPEFLLFDGENPKSAIDVIKSGTLNRINIGEHQYYYDNVLAECAVAPSDSKEKTISNFRECIAGFAKLVDPYKIKIQASVVFPDNELLHKDARKVGCSAEYCAYKMDMVPPQTAAIKKGNLRSCGGHIHLGSEFLKQDGPETILFVYMMDLFLAIPSLWLDKDPTSPARRSLYGQAGRYRPKDYGVEYRSLGNFWLKSPRLVSLIYDLSVFTHEFVETGKAWNLWKFDEEIFFSSSDLSNSWTCNYDFKLLQEAINKSNKIMAQQFYDLAQKYLPSHIKDEIEFLTQNEEGDLYQNWGVNSL